MTGPSGAGGPSFPVSGNSGNGPIGVFDSGVGGLTVLRALRSALPAEEFIYLGDTARLPYGSKSRATIVRYALSSTRFLLDQGADFLVIACNTATALALNEIKASTEVPVLGVIETGANEAANSRARFDRSAQSNATRIFFIESITLPSDKDGCHC